MGAVRVRQSAQTALTRTESVTSINCRGAAAIESCLPSTGNGHHHASFGRFHTDADYRYERPGAVEEERGQHEGRQPRPTQTSPPPVQTGPEPADGQVGQRCRDKQDGGGDQDEERKRNHDLPLSVLRKPGGRSLRGDRQEATGPLEARFGEPTPRRQLLGSSDAVKQNESSALPEFGARLVYPHRSPADRDRHRPERL